MSKPKIYEKNIPIEKYILILFVVTLTGEELRQVRYCLLPDVIGIMIQTYCDIEM